MIYFTSDLHLGHDREFIYRKRGFESVEEMNENLVLKWNTLVKPEDGIYILGDVMLGADNSDLNYVKQLQGRIHLIRGNHDTDRRLELFAQIPSFVEFCDARYLKCGHYHFYLTHYPCLTGNIEKESLTQMTLNLHGHTHSDRKFFYDLPYCYNVGVDAHGGKPVSIDEIIEDMKNKVEECKAFL